MNKIPDIAKYITTQKFNNFTAEKFAPRLKEANLVSKTCFDNKLALIEKLPQIKVSRCSKDAK